MPEPGKDLAGAMAALRSGISARADDESKGSTIRADELLPAELEGPARRGMAEFQQPLRLFPPPLIMLQMKETP